MFGWKSYQSAYMTKMAAHSLACGFCSVFIRSELECGLVHAFLELFLSLPLVYWSGLDDVLKFAVVVSCTTMDQSFKGIHVTNWTVNAKTVLEMMRTILLWLPSPKNASRPGDRGMLRCVIFYHLQGSDWHWGSYVAGLVDCCRSSSSPLYGPRTLNTLSTISSG